MPDVEMNESANGAAAKVLYVLRHAEAAERDATSYDDRLRDLTPRGIRRTKRAAAGLRRLEIRFESIVSSPLVRAKETARIVAERTRHTGEIVLNDALSPGSDPYNAI